MSFENLFIFHFQISVIRYRNKLKQSLNKEAFQRRRKVCEIWGEHVVKSQYNMALDGTVFAYESVQIWRENFPLVPLVPPALQIMLWTVQHSGTNGRTDAAQWCRNRGGQGGHCPPPPYLADQLTLFQPGRADNPHLLLLAPPMFFTFRHHYSRVRAVLWFIHPSWYICPARCDI